MKNRIRILVDETLAEVLAEIKASDFEPVDLSYDIEAPKVKAFGDLSVNVAFQLSKKLKKDPFGIAEAFKGALDRKIKREQMKFGWLQGVSVEKPGFINFKFSHATLANELLEISRLDEKFGCSEQGKGAGVLIEFVSANPTGPLTIAHGRQAAVGDTLARIFAALGYRAHREFYFNYSGPHIPLFP